MKGALNIWMGKEQIRLRWDGPALDDRQIDVREFAPSLLALGDLIVAANKTLNGDNASVRVAISAAPEQNCFEIDLHFFLNVYAAVRGMLIKDEISTIKEILEWLDILTPHGVAAGVMALLSQLAGKKVKDEKVIQTADGENIVQLTIIGDGNHIEVNPQVWELAKNPKVRENVANFLSPLTKEGFDSVSFIQKDGARQISKFEGTAIVQNPPEIKIEEQTLNEQPIELWGSPYGTVFDEHAKQWRFNFGDGPKYVDISETDISKDAYKRGRVDKDDRYHLKLTMTQSLTAGGYISTKYKAHEVLDFVPASREKQADWIDDDIKRRPEGEKN